MKPSDISPAQVKKRYREALKGDYPQQEIDSIFYWLLDHYIHWNRADFQIYKDKPLLKQSLDQLEDALDRLLRGEPIQYIIRYAWFSHLRLEVSPAVLIPRPETEELAILVIHELADCITNNPHVLDIGTGSGCLAIAIKTKVPHCHVTAIDKSQEALEIARRNALSYAAEIDFHLQDILCDPCSQQSEFYDIIVSNPPYIPLNEKQLLSRHVADSEPESALFVPDDDPLIFYKAIIRYARQHLAPSGKIYVEVHENLSGETLQLFQNSGYFGAMVLKDYRRKNRFIKAGVLP